MGRRGPWHADNDDCSHFCYFQGPYGEAFGRLAVLLGGGIYPRPSKNHGCMGTGTEEIRNDCRIVEKHFALHYRKAII